MNKTDRTEMIKMNYKIEKALRYAKKAHQGQTRKGTKIKYVAHPIKVYEILKGVTDDKNILCAALLHDVIEDTEYTHNNIALEFGDLVADIVQEVTKDKNGNFNIKTKEGLMVKLADMLHNIHDSTDKKYIKKKIQFISGESHE